MNSGLTTAAGISALVLMFACATEEDGYSDSAADTGGDTGPAGEESSGSTGMTPAQDWPENDSAGIGGECTWHDDCESLYCLRFGDVPLDQGTCSEPGAYGTLKITANVRDLITQEAVGGAEVKLISALGAIANPVAAQTLATATSGDDGRFSTESMNANGNVIGLAAMMTKSGYYPTLTGVAAPFEDSNDYAPGNDIHDMWIVPTDSVQRWSDLLAEEEFLAQYLPLGELGGIIAFVRDEDTGAPIAGAVVQSEDPEDTYSVARYLNEAQDGFTDDMTTSNGIAVVFGADLGEGFEAFLGEDKIGSNVGASADGTVLVLAIQ